MFSNLGLDISLFSVSFGSCHCICPFTVYWVLITYWNCYYPLCDLWKIAFVNMGFDTHEKLCIISGTSCSKQHVPLHQNSRSALKAQLQGKFKKCNIVSGFVVLAILRKGIFFKSFEHWNFPGLKGQEYRGSIRPKLTSSNPGIPQWDVDLAGLPPRRQEGLQAHSYPTGRTKIWFDIFTRCTISCFRKQ